VILSRSGHAESPFETWLFANFLKRLLDVSFRLFHLLVVVVAESGLVVFDQLIAARKLNQSEGDGLLRSVAHEFVVDQFDCLFDKIVDFLLEFVLH